MRSVDTLVSSNTLLDKMSVHLNGLLRGQEPQVDKAVQLLDNMFLHASKAMETDSDKQVLSVLKCQVSSFIGVTLGVKPFLEQHERQQKKEEDSDSDSDNEDHKLSWFSAQEKEKTRHDLWAEKKKYHEENDLDIYAPEHAEHERLRQLEEEHYGSAGSGEDEEDEEEVKDGSSSESEYEEVIERVAVKSREIGGAGGFEVVRRKQKKKKTVITTNFTYSHNTYDNNQAQNNDNYNNNNYRRQPPRHRVRITEFRPKMLERLPCEQTFCMPVFFPSEDSYSVSQEREKKNWKVEMIDIVL